jgi:HSP20 family protein
MKNEALAPAKEKEDPAASYPAFVEAEKLLERMAEFTRLTSQKAYDYFLRRRDDFGLHFDDWLKAEMDILRPTPIEITETKDDINVRASVPGFKPEEIELSIKDNLLIMSGETRSEEKKEDEKTFLNEWRSNHFCRQVILPSEVETDGVNATLKDGILKLSLKKKAVEEAAKIAVIAA